MQPPLLRRSKCRSIHLRIKRKESQTGSLSVFLYKTDWSCYDAAVNEWKQNAGFALAGVALAALGCWGMFNGQRDAKMVGLVVLGLLVATGATWLVSLDMREILSIRKARAKMGNPARIMLEMPYHELAARFQALARVDELTFVERDCLSWNSQSFAIIRIRRESETDWMALYWVRANWHYTDTQLRQVCKSAGQELPAEFKKSKAHGLIIYSKGVFSIYPEPHKEQVQDAFMDNIFLPTREAFMAWLTEYGEEA